MRLVVRRVLMVGLFLPTILSHLLQWGDPLTSHGFDYAPNWFRYLQLMWQCAIAAMLLAPFRLIMPSVRSVSLLSLVLFAGALLLLANPVSSAEKVLVYSMLLNVGLFGFLVHVRPEGKASDDDVRFLLHLFLVGFALQVLAYLAFNITPSHSQPEFPFPRFNGLTNDSLATALLLPALVPAAVTHRYSSVMCGLLLGCGFLTGSLFAIIFIPIVLLRYLVVRGNQKAVLLILVAVGVVVLLNLSSLVQLFEYKSYSVLTHLRFYIELIGWDLAQPTKDCSTDFCESLIESSLHLSSSFTLLYYAGLIWFVIKALRVARNADVVCRDAVCILGLTLLTASFVHPIPLIPFACTFFILMASRIEAR